LRYTSAGLLELCGWLLAGDFIFILINQIEPLVLPIVLKRHGATDQQIALLLSSIPAGISLLVNPIVSYRSDRTRSRWGRRIPYLALATPLATLFLALTPFAPEIARHATGNVVLTFGLLIGLYQVFQSVIAAVYFYLLRDVVPMEVMGRFLSVMRIFSALGMFVLNYWLIGLAETHAKEIFVGVALLNLIGIGAMCWFVREGEYPPVVDTVAKSGGLGRLTVFRALANFAIESFSHPVYRWTYLSRLLVYACMPLSGFVVLFARHELELDLGTVGKYMAWPSFAWLLLAYPTGRLMDRIGPFAIMKFGLACGAIGYVASFFVVVGAKTFLTATLVTGLAYWIVMLAQIMLAQVIFHPARMGQLSAANVLIQSVVVALVTGPASGFLLEQAKRVQWHLAPPFAGTVELGHYRFIFIMLAALYALSLLCLARAQTHWRKRGGPHAYAPPL
jgi:MFS family permease